MDNARHSEASLPRGVEQIDCSFSAIMKQHAMKGPFCQVGSLINKDDVADELVASWRHVFHKIDPQGFMGIDLFPGPNVDVVADLCDPDFPKKHRRLIGQFRTVFCYALLEHVENPFAAAKNITALLAPGGHLLFGGPWAWGYHAYPRDYFRISFDGLAAIFPEMEWQQRWYMGTKPGIGLELDPKREKQLFRMNNVTGLASLITEKALPYLNLGAVGRKRAVPRSIGSRLAAGLARARNIGRAPLFPPVAPASATPEARGPFLRSIDRYGSMEEHYKRIRRGDSDIPLIAGGREDRLSGLEPLFALPPGFSVLDVGCHEAFIAEAMALSGATIIHGVDLHEPSLELARRRMEPHSAILKRVDLCDGMAALKRELPLLPKYDVVLYLGIYHHMLRQMPGDALSEFVTELFPMAGRYLAIRTPPQFMDRLREEPVMSRFRLVHRHDENPALSPVEIYEPR